jgi:anthranilate phosphoribosyltransferase
VLLNAAAAFVVTGLDPDMKTGLERARDSIDSGRAKQKLEQLINFTRCCQDFVRKEF